MKKILVLLLVLLLVFGMLPVSVFAAGTISITAGKVTGTAGTTVDVPISFPDNPGINNAGFYVNYDSATLTFKGWTAGTVFAESEIDGNFESNPMIISAYTGKNNKTAKGTFITLQFEIKNGAAAKEYPITLETGRLGGFTNIAEEELTPVYTNGSIIVGSDPRRGVKIQSDDLSNVKISMNGQETLKLLVAAYDERGRFVGTHIITADLVLNLSEWSDYAIRGFLTENSSPICEKIHIH